MNQDTLPNLGQQYRSAKASAFGAPSQIIWVVQQSWVGADGIPYVRLIKERDATEKKTVSAMTLEDRHNFIPL